MAVRIAPAALTGFLVLGTCLACPEAVQAYTVKQTDSGSTIRWHANRVTLRIDDSMDAYFANMLPVRPVVDEAAAAWSGLEGVPDLLINEGKPGPLGFDSDRGGNNGVYLVKDWELAESSLAVTVATFESKSGRIVDTDILVNPNHPFGMMPDGPDQRGRAFDLRGVMTHEMGHVLGLGESYDERLATMWPNIARGETHQRDIDPDDQSGAEDAYSGAMLSESDGGCDGASVVAKRAQGSVLWSVLVCGALVAVGIWMRTRSRAQPERGTAAFAFALLFAAPWTAPSSDAAENERVEVVRTLALRRLPADERHAGLAHAARSSSPKVRVAAAAVLERVGSREDLAVASALALDADPEVRRVAQGTLARLRTAPPLARIASEHPEAVERLRALLNENRGVVTGEAVGVSVYRKNGLVWSRYLVHGDQAMTEVDIPGGSLDGFTQVVSEQEPPADGDTIVVALRERGPHAWTHYREGVIYGGWLGEGPAIEWQPE